MPNVLKLRIQLRRDTEANWEKYNPTLLNGEAAVSSDTNQVKYGDGKRAWKDLPYAAGSAELEPDLLSLVKQEGKMTLSGFDTAAEGSYPIKGPDGRLKWLQPSTNTEEGLAEIIAKQGEDIKLLQNLSHQPVQISIHDILVKPNEETGVVDIPIATRLALGVVMGTNAENGVDVNEDGTMTVNSLNVNKLSQTTGEEFILNANY